MANTSKAYIDQDSADALELARLGYKQELKRAFSPLELFCLVFGIFGLFPSITSVLTYALPNGGPVALVWGWGVCCVFLIFVTLALAELGSAAPTSGGLYYWSFKYSSPRWRRLLSWVVGYSNTIGLIAGVASTDWGCAVELMAAVSIGSNQTFTATTSQTFGVYVVILLLHAVISSLATSIVAKLQFVYALMNVLLCLAIIILLPVATPQEFKNPASYAFGGFTNLGSWPNGFAFLLSFLAPLWTVCGFDTSLHLSEEASNAKVSVPIALIAGTFSAAIIGWAINITIAFQMGTDIDGIMNSPIGQPMAAILFNSLGQKGTLVIWVIVFSVQFFVGASCLLVSSRQTFAFARDGGLVFSRVLYRINTRTQTPVNCACFSAFISFLLGLLAFAGPSAVSAIFSLGVVGAYISYTIPIVSRFTGGTEWRPGPFSLGKFGLPVAIVAVIWMIFGIVIVVFPSLPDPSGPTMNYTSVVLGGWITLCLVYYYFPVYGGVHWFRGPIRNIVSADEQADHEISVEDEKIYLEEPKATSICQ